MRLFRRSRFAPIVATQISLFVDEHRDVIDEANARLDAYERADRSEAEELYGDYVDSVETGTEILADMRDRYAATLDDPTEYVAVFHRGVAKRLRPFSLELENR